MGRMKEVFQRQQEEDLYYSPPEDKAWTDAEIEQQYQDYLEQEQTATGAATTGSTNNAERTAQQQQR